MNKIAVIGLGNLLFKDEGLGMQALKYLKAKHSEIKADLIEAGTPGFGLLDLFKKYDKVLVLDAIDMGASPGTMGRFSVEEIVARVRGFSLHEFGLAEVLKIGQSISEDFKHIIIFGIQPQDTSMGEELTKVVQGQLSNLVLEVIKEVATAKAQNMIAKGAK